MDMREAIEFLKTKLSEIPRLERLPPNNQGYSVWLKVIESILEEVFGCDSSEYRDFIKHEPIYGINMTERDRYLKDLIRRKTVILSIIEKYKILGIETKPAAVAGSPPKAFIAHGGDSPALRNLKNFLEALGVKPLVVEEQPSEGRSVSENVDWYARQADFVIILATGDDTVKDKRTGKETKQPRQNVIHEIGLAQEKLPGKIIYLLEEGAEFPSNIRPKVWESFKQRNMMKAFLGILRELRAYDMLKLVKPTEE